jgi:hypothetical protein
MAELCETCVFCAENYEVENAAEKLTTKSKNLLIKFTYKKLTFGKDFTNLSNAKSNKS